MLILYNVDISIIIVMEATHVCKVAQPNRKEKTTSTRGTSLTYANIKLCGVCDYGDMLVLAIV